MTIICRNPVLSAIICCVRKLYSRYVPWSIWPTLSLYGPSRWSIWSTPCQYGPPLVDIAKTVIARLCYIPYNIAIIVRKLEGWPSGNEPVSTKKPLFSNRGNLLILANNNIMSFSSLHRNTQGKRTVRTSYIVAYYCNSWAISTDRLGHIDCSMGHIVRAISEVGHIDWRPLGSTVYH